MAIKEFIISPQNYWEEGYFDGDYTLPNVAKTFLECDIDNVKGGRVITGPYFQDNYIDGTYWHNNSIKFEMSVDAMIVQVATVGLSGYYQEGYYESGYSEQRGSFFVLTAELTRVGEDVFGQGTWSSIATMNITAVKTVSADTELTVTFTQTAYGARDRDIDLFAFSDAALTAQANVITSNNISLSSVFSVATEVTRYRDLASEETSLFDIAIANSRSRAFTIETQAAFSFAVSYENYRPFESEISSEATVSATISHIHGADLTAFSDATLSATLENVVKETSISLESSASVYCAGGFTFEYSANLFAQTNCLARGSLRFQRPLQIFSQSATISSEISKFGSGTIRSVKDTQVEYYATALNTEIAVEGWIYLETNIQNPQFIQYGYLGEFNSFNQLFRVRKNGDGRWAFGVRASNGTIVEIISTLTLSTTDQWIHVAASLNRNTRQATLWINGTQYANGTFASISWFDSNHILRIGNISSSINSDLWIDEVHLQSSGSGFLSNIGRGIGSSTITVPTTRKINNASTTNFLGHFDTDFSDDVSITQLAEASLSSISLVSSKLSGPVKYSASIESSATLSATISHIEGADLTAFSNAALTASVEKLKIVESTQSSEFSQSTEGNAVRDAESSLVSESTVSGTALRIQPGAAEFESVASQLTATVRLAGLFADDLSQFSLNADANVVRSAISAISSDFAISLEPLRIQSSSGDFNSDFTAEANGFTAKVASSDILAEFEVLSSANRVRFSNSNADISFNLDIEPNILGKIESTLFNSATLSADVSKIVGFTSAIELSCQSSIVTDNSLIKGFDSVQSSSLEMTTSVHKIMDGIIETESIASELVVAVKEAVADVDVQITSNLDLTITKFTGFESLLDSQAQVTSTILRIRNSSIDNIQAEVTVSAIGTKAIVEGHAYFNAVASKLIAIAKTSGNSSDMQATSLLSVSAGIIKGASVSVQSEFNTDISASKICSAHSEQTASFEQTGQGTILVNAFVDISSALTFAVTVRELRLDDIVYVIPGEIWTFQIDSETRRYTVGSETRTYILQGE